MNLNEVGEIAYKYWEEIPEHFENVKLGEFIIMPNHMHGVIFIGCDFKTFDACGYALWRVPTEPWLIPTFDQISNIRRSTIRPLQKNSLGSIINHYKGSVKRWCNINDYKDFRWQSRYHDKIIRSRSALINIENYIINNPQNWDKN